MISLEKYMQSLIWARLIYGGEEEPHNLWTAVLCSAQGIMQLNQTPEK